MPYSPYDVIPFDPEAFRPVGKKLRLFGVGGGGKRPAGQAQSTAARQALQQAGTAAKKPPAVAAAKQNSLLTDIRNTTQKNTLLGE
jgi:hypothetical protein